MIGKLDVQNLQLVDLARSWHSDSGRDSLLLAGLDLTIERWRLPLTHRDLLPI
jgi:hypothetical protein